MNAGYAPELESPGGRMTRPAAMVGRRLPNVRNETTTSAAGVSAYEAGSTASRTRSWHAPNYSANNAVLPVLGIIRDRSREATRNNGYAKEGVETAVSELIGTGIKPLSKTPDKALAAILQERFLRWTDECDADGLLDFYGQQTQAARGWKTSGEMFVRLRPRRVADGLTVPLQLQVLEPDLCPHTHSTYLPNGNRVRAGIEFNPIGKRVGYYLHPSRPGDFQDYDAGTLRRIPAESILHIYEPLRAGQLRGIPEIAQALVWLQNINKLTDATLMRQLVANLLVGFIKPAASLIDADLDPMTGAAIDRTDTPPSIAMEPATIQELRPGEEISWSEPPDVGTSYNDFIRANLRAAMTAAGVPYELATGDMTGLNDRVIRVLLNKFRRRLRAQQHQVIAFQFCRQVWRAWMDAGFYSGTLPLPADYAVNPWPYLAVKWIPEGWAYIHPLQDVQAAKERMQAGLTSRSSEVSDLGEDADQVDVEQARDNARADSLGLRYTSDGRTVTNRTGQRRELDPDPENEPDADPAGAVA